MNDKAKGLIVLGLAGAGIGAVILKSRASESVALPMTYVVPDAPIVDYQCPNCDYTFTGYLEDEMICPICGAVMVSSAPISMFFPGEDPGAYGYYRTAPAYRGISQILRYGWGYEIWVDHDTAEWMGAGLLGAAVMAMIVWIPGAPFLWPTLPKASAILAGMGTVIAPLAFYAECGLIFRFAWIWSVAPFQIRPQPCQRVEPKTVKPVEYVCPECGSVFATDKQLVAHLLTYHYEPSLVVDPTGATVRWVCPICQSGQVFDTPEELEQHILNNHGPNIGLK